MSSENTNSDGDDNGDIIQSCTVNGATAPIRSSTELGRTSTEEIIRAAANPPQDITIPADTICGNNIGIYDYEGQGKPNGQVTGNLYVGISTGLEQIEGMELPDKLPEWFNKAMSEPWLNTYKSLTPAASHHPPSGSTSPTWSKSEHAFSPSRPNTPYTPIEYTFDDPNHLGVEAVEGKSQEWKQHEQHRDILEKVRVWWMRSISVVVPGEGARDHLALERTFLSYHRLSLMLVIFATLNVQFHILTNRQVISTHNEASADIIGKPLSIIFCIAAIMVSFIGWWRWYRWQNALLRGKGLMGGWELEGIAVGVFFVGCVGSGIAMGILVSGI